MLIDLSEQRVDRERASKETPLKKKKFFKAQESYVAKLDLYPSPPFSPPTLRKGTALDSLRGGSLQDQHGGMDGDNNYATKQHDPFSFPSSLSPSQNVVQQQQMSPHHSPERFRRPTARATGRGAHVNVRQSHGQGIALQPEYAAYGYPVVQQPSSLAVGDSLQNLTLSSQAPMSPESVRQHYSQRQADLQAFNYPLQHPQQSPYDPQFVYELAQSDSAHMPYNISLSDSFQAHSAEPLGGMPPLLSVPQYRESSEPASEYLTRYLSTQRQSTAYQQESPPNQITTVPFSSTINSYDSVRTVGNMERQHQHHQRQLYQQPQPQQNTQFTTDVNAAYRRYQELLVAAFEYVRAGRLVRASSLVLDITKWLVGNARLFGLSLDDPQRYQGRLKLWEDLNNCWLALFQKQKVSTSPPRQAQSTTDLLTIETMKHMGEVVIELCDKLQPMGLVDYQMGLWEEIILDSKKEKIPYLK
ncbi:hypothetical protein PISL3812_05842 [Talaromyces islandicus]|uniref:Uncharacterized protein n=1 Tax=Talaromyces islandicus TaxID=28573 RepID=A0A0U1LZS6_TALIS|nr:hypothetical protein PISL3812_05842 [Talaromyces islandicus]